MVEHARTEAIEQIAEPTYLALREAFIWVQPSPITALTCPNRMLAWGYPWRGLSSTHMPTRDTQKHRYQIRNQIRNLTTPLIASKNEHRSIANYLRALYCVAQCQSWRSNYSTHSFVYASFGHSFHDCGCWTCNSVVFHRTILQRRIARTPRRRYYKSNFVLHVWWEYYQRNCQPGVIHGTFAVVSNSVRKYTFWIVIIMRPGLFGFSI
jgi:hypothetical protein